MIIKVGNAEVRLNFDLQKFNWIAQDSNGFVRLFEDKPTISFYSGSWYSSSGSAEINKLFKPNRNYNNSLVEIQWNKIKLDKILNDKNN